MQRNFVFLFIIIFSNIIADNLPLTQRYFHQEDQGHSYTRGTYMIILSDASLETYLTDDNTGNFVEFKKSQGYDVVIQYFNDVGGTANNLKSYLQWYIEEQDPLMEYVLLVGDVNGNYSIPSFYMLYLSEESIETLLTVKAIGYQWYSPMMETGRILWGIQV